MSKNTGQKLMDHNHNASKIILLKQLEKVKGLYFILFLVRKKVNLRKGCPLGAM